MPAAKTVRISKSAHADLKQMADEDGLSLRKEMDRIIERQKRDRFFDKLNAQFEQMTGKERESYDEETRSLEGTLGDGLEDE